MLLETLETLNMALPSTPTSPATIATAPSPALEPDLYCYEAMPAPSELAALASIAQTRALAPSSPISPISPSAPSPPSPPISTARACPAPCSDGLCWCLDPCAPDRVCTNNILALSRKRKTSPSPPAYRPGGTGKYPTGKCPGDTDTGDHFWTQTVRLFHPTDFEYTTVEIDSNQPLSAIFHQLCADQRVKRSDVVFVWIRKRSTGRVQQVTLSDESVPSTIGMREGLLETIECEFV